MAEKGEHGSKRMSSEAHRMHAAGLLSLFSVLVTIEGAARLNGNTGKDVDWDGDSTTFPPVVLLMGGVFEVCFGLFGLFVGLAELLLSYGNSALTMLSMFTMATGWFTFVVYTIAAPAFVIDTVSASPDPRLSLSEFRTIVAMSLFGSVAYCASLQGGQFFFANMLYNHQSPSSKAGEVYTSGFYMSRLYYYLFVVFVGGLSQLIAGCVAYTSAGTGELTMISEDTGEAMLEPIVALPYAILYPGMTIAVAVVVLVYGIMLLLGGMGVIQPGEWGAVLGAFVFICELAFMNFGQPGYLAGRGGNAGISELGVVQIGLTLSLVLMPAYIFSKLSTAYKAMEQE